MSHSRSSGAYAETTFNSSAYRSVAEKLHRHERATAQHTPEFT